MRQEFVDREPAPDGPAAAGQSPAAANVEVVAEAADGIAATRLLVAQPHPPAVLVLTTFDADELVLRAL